MIKNVTISQLHISKENIIPKRTALHDVYIL